MLVAREPALSGVGVVLDVMRFTPIFCQPVPREEPSLKVETASPKFSPFARRGCALARKLSRISPRGEIQSNKSRTSARLVVQSNNVHPPYRGGLIGLPCPAKSSLGLIGLPGPLAIFRRHLSRFRPRPAELAVAAREKARTADARDPAARGASAIPPTCSPARGAAKAARTAP